MTRTWIKFEKIFKVIFYSVGARKKCLMKVDAKPPDNHMTWYN